MPAGKEVEEPVDAIFSLQALNTVIPILSNPSNILDFILFFDFCESKLDIVKFEKLLISGSYNALCLIRPAAYQRFLLFTNFLSIIGKIV